MIILQVESFVKRFTPDDDLDFTLDDIGELSPDPVKDTETFFSIIHPAGYQRFTQDLAADWPKSYWSRTDEPLRMPPTTGKEQIFVSVNPICQRITDADLANPKFSGKALSWIAERVASKNRTVAAITTQIRDYDAKDFTDPTPLEIEAAYQALRADPKHAQSPEKALRNQAFGNAKSAKYKTNPEHYKALALAHVEALTPAPSVIVASGGGYNCYWLLDEPFLIRTDEHDYSHHVTSYAADVQKRWVHMDARADQGVNDIRRIFRPVGTKNHKPAYGPNFPVVSFVKNDFDLRYSLADLVKLLPEVKPQAPAVTTRKATQATTEAQAGEQAAYEGDSVIFAYNAKHKIADVLLANGYTQHGDRMMRPGGDGQPGVDIDATGNRSRHWSHNDAMYSIFWRRPFDVFCTYEYGGNLKRAVAAAAAELGMVKAPVDVPATIELLKLWIRTHSFEPYIPDQLKTLRTDRKTGEQTLIYITDSTDTKTAIAVCVAMLEANRLDINIGKKRLGKLAGVSCNTALKALERLNGFLFTVTPDKFGARVALVEKCRLQQIDPSLDVVMGLTTRDQSCENDKLTGVIDEYTPRMAGDCFLNGKSRHVKQQMTEAAKTLGITDKEALEQFTFKSFGESGLRVIDAMLRVGADMTAQELAEETGKKLSAIRTACARLVEHGLLEATREGSTGPKVYGLADNVWARLEAVAPHLRTYKLSDQRENKRLECAQAWTQAEIAKAKDAGDVELVTKLDKRKERQGKQRIPLLVNLYPDLSMDDITDLAYKVAAYKRNPKTEAAVKTARQLAQDEHTLQVTCIINCLTNYANQTGTLPAMPTGDEPTVTIEGQTFERAMVADVMRNPALVKRTMQGVEDIYAQAAVTL